MGLDRLIASLDAAALAEAAAALLTILEGGEGKAPSSSGPAGDAQQPPGASGPGGTEYDAEEAWSLAGPAGDAATGGGLPRQPADRLALTEFFRLAAQRSGREAERKNRGADMETSPSGGGGTERADSDAAEQSGVSSDARPPSPGGAAYAEESVTAAEDVNAAAPTVSDMETLSEFFRRDSRRYDSGFGE